MLIKNVRLGKDAETAVTKGGKPMLKLVCTYDSGWGENKKTVWMNAVKWGDKNDGILPYLKKGAVITISCDDVFPESYTAKDGTLKASLTANVVRIELIPLPAQQARQPQQQEARQQRYDSNAGEVDFDDDIPF